jgi:hypothetical protein
MVEVSRRMTSGENMRVFAGLMGLVIVGMLGGCASSLSMPTLDVDLFEGSGAATGAEDVAMAPPAEPPPLPARNPKKPKTANGRQSQMAASRFDTRTPGATEKTDKKNDGSFLSQMNPFKVGAPAVSDTVKTDLSTTAVYTVLAQQIHTCWLTPAAPKLPKHGFHAEVAPNSQHAKIVLYKKTANNKRGLQVYRIIIDSGMTSSITAYNHKLSAKMDEDFKRDIARWIKGDSRCKE